VTQLVFYTNPQSRGRIAFEAYWARLSERPAFQRASEIDNALVSEAEKAKAE
jgi:hypothetical protein